jgi:hypothetical protein
MFKDRMLEALKRSKKRSKDAKTARAIAKMGSQQRLSSQEFLKIYDSLWEEGPQVKHQTPDESARCTTAGFTP